MRLAQIVIRAVALLRTALSRQQAELLAPARRHLILFNGDATGRSAVHEVRSLLAHAQIAVADFQAVTIPMTAAIRTCTPAATCSSARSPITQRDQVTSMQRDRVHLSGGH